MNIAFSIDDNYSEQLATTIVSILKNDKSNSEFNFFVLDNGISEENKQKILELKSFKSFEISFIPVNGEMFENLPIIYHITSVSYNRLLLPALINVDKLLFLDCDLIVREDLTELYNMSFENSYACVVKERLSKETYIQKQIKNLGLKYYFNAGVMLLNLKKIREDFIEKKCNDFVKTSPEKILLMDQCVLNYAFQDDIKFLGKEWNYQYKLGYSKDLYNAFSKENEVKILHFVGVEKPYCGYAHPFENEYFKYLKFTSYKVPYLIFKLKMWRMFLKRAWKSIEVLINIYI